MPITRPDHRVSNLLGTVSQSSGAPTGSIIEQATTVNGSYIRFADGTQICYKQLTLANAGMSAAGSIFFSLAMSAGSWAANFITTPVVAAAGTDSSGNGWAMQAIYHGPSAAGTWRTANYAGGGVTTNLWLVAIGRWF